MGEADVGIFEIQKKEIAMTEYDEALEVCIGIQSLARETGCVITSTQQRKSDAIRMYHICPRASLPSILIHGILPACAIGGYTPRSGMNISGSVMDRVCVTNDPRLIVLEQCGLSWTVRNDAVVLIVDLPQAPDPVQYHGGGTYTVSNLEFTLAHVPADQIVATVEIKNYINGPL